MSPSYLLDISRLRSRDHLPAHADVTDAGEPQPDRPCLRDLITWGSPVSYFTKSAATLRGIGVYARIAYTIQQLAA
ncbi:hypothetical protein R75461_07473 [Paraburkholderia nemoris]|uniref:hypothetical protein n=1 Tax=Paraburkholderia nemoris TaxID=2793076 RepID=UPI00190D2334|nr:MULTISPECIES: hypothetical protein [Paraburkholderia]MBK3786336.1 hypothetical protein [Paraburkholderia aspalathi]CAE6851113.1 hypothetical protein R75461_07473 [Paraburkholderia nemoris]